MLNFEIFTMAYKIDQALIVTESAMYHLSNLVRCSHIRAKRYTESVRIVVSEIKKLRNESIIETVCSRTYNRLRTRISEYPKEGKGEFKGKITDVHNHMLLK